MLQPFNKKSGRCQDKLTLLSLHTAKFSGPSRWWNDQSGRDKEFTAPLCSTAAVKLGAPWCPVCFRQAFGFLTSKPNTLLRFSQSSCSPRSPTAAVGRGHKAVPMPLASLLLGIHFWEQPSVCPVYLGACDPGQVPYTLHAADQTRWEQFPGTSSVIAQWSLRVFIGKWGDNQSKPVGKHKKIRSNLSCG